MNFPRIRTPAENRARVRRLLERNRRNALLVEARVRGAGLIRPPAGSGGDWDRAYTFDLRGRLTLWYNDLDGSTWIVSESVRAG